MNKEYNEMVTNLAKPGEAILATLTPAKCHLLHMAVGMSGESTELLEAFMLDDFVLPVTEEAGDFEFYFHGYCQGLGITEDQIPVEQVDCNAIDRIYNSLLIETGNLLDMTKKFVIYNKEIDSEALIKQLSKVKNGLFAMYNYFGKFGLLQRKDALEANMHKLLKSDKARFKSGAYSDQQAQDRADKQ